MRLIARALFGLVETCPVAILPLALFVTLVTTGSAVFAQSAHGGSGGHAGARPSGARTFTARPAPPPAPHPQHSRTVAVPYPVYYGGYYYGNYYYGGDGSNAYGAQQPAPAYDYGLADGAPGQSPVAIINQGYAPDSANPVTRDYSDADLPPPGPDYRGNYRADEQPTIYLLAMTDHTIIPAIAYWVDGDTLNYITTEGSQNRVSLSLIDREFSRQLNDSRNVEFKLPPAK